MINHSTGSASGSKNTWEQAFLAHHKHLLRVAYRMFGTIADAEDAVQDAYVRVLEVNPRSVEDLKRYLVRIVVNRCIDRWKSLAHRRETYVGPWLPEPLLESKAPDPAKAAELSESLSMAFMMLLESLNPVERAVFLLHEVFGYDFAEVASVVDKSPDNCRQIAHRARLALQGNRPLVRSDTHDRQAQLNRFLYAWSQNDLVALETMLSQEVVFYSDGGGRVNASRIPIVGKDRVIRFILGLSRKALRLGLALRTTEVDVNGAPGVVVWADKKIHGVMTCEFVGNELRKVFYVLNPDKLASVSDFISSTGGLGP